MFSRPAAGNHAARHAGQRRVEGIDPRGQVRSALALALPKQKVRIDVSAYTSYTPDFGEQRKSPFVASVSIILDEPPEIRQVTLAKKIEEGQSLPVELTVKSLSPITQVDCGLEDPDKPDEFAQDPKKVKRKTDERADTWLATLATEKLPVGGYKLLFRARMRSTRPPSSRRRC